jgi:hypothetical protein
MPDPSEDPQQEQIKKIVEQVIKQQKNGMEPTSEEETKIQKCAVDCSNAYNVSLQTLRYCLTQGGKFADPSNLNKIQDCSELCHAVSSFLLRESEMKNDILKICSKACEECNKFCEQFTEDKQMAACGQYAKVAGESCKEVA